MHARLLGFYADEAPKDCTVLPIDLPEGALAPFDRVVDGVIIRTASAGMQAWLHHLDNHPGQRFVRPFAQYDAFMTRMRRRLPTEEMPDPDLAGALAAFRHRFNRQG